MNYEDFVSLVGKTVSLYSRKALLSLKGEYFPKTDPDTPDFFFFNSNSTGGTSGGSCWDEGDSDPHYSYSDPNGAREALQGFDVQFDAVLTKIRPDITFLQYKSIYNDVVKSCTRTEGEYYGNSTDYLTMYCEVRDLYARLVEGRLL